MITEFVEELQKIRQTVPDLLMDAEPFVLATFYDCVDLLLLRLADPQVQEWAKTMNRTDLYTYLHQMVYREVLVRFSNRSGGDSPFTDTLNQMYELANESELFADFPLYHESKLFYYQQPFIEDEEQYFPIDLEQYIPDPILHKVLTDLAALFPQATILYAFGSLSAIRHVMPLLCAGGVLLISDKAQFDIGEMRGHNPCPITIHGNSFAHDANFPLMINYAQALGYGGIQTKSFADSLQTLMLVSQSTIPESVLLSFQHNYVENNLNLVLCDLSGACKRLRRYGHIEDAAHVSMSVLKHDPRNCEALFTWASYHLSEGDFEKALYFLGKPHDDYLGIYHFSDLKGQALQGLKHYSAACDYFRQELLHTPENAQAWRALIECYLATDEFSQAWLALQKASTMIPEEQVMLTALMLDIKQKVIERWQAGCLEIAPTALSLLRQEVLTL